MIIRGILLLAVILTTTMWGLVSLRLDKEINTGRRLSVVAVQECMQHCGGNIQDMHTTRSNVYCACPGGSPAKTIQNYEYK